MAFSASSERNIGVQTRDAVQRLISVIGRWESEIVVVIAVTLVIGAAGSTTGKMPCLVVNATTAKIPGKFGTSFVFECLATV